jgi:hypothetical protein
VGDISTTTQYKITGTPVLTATTLGSGVINASLTTNLANLNIITQLNTDFALTITGLSGNRSLYMGRKIVAGELECVIQAVDNGGTIGQILHLNNLDSAGVIIGTGLDTVVSGLRLYVDGATTIDGNLNLTTGSAFQVNSVNVLSATTLGSGVVNASLTSNTGNLTNTGNLNLTTGSAFQINSVNVLSATTLGSGVVNASLTSNTGNLTNAGNLNLTTGSAFQINSVNVLSATTLGSGVVNASLTSNTGNLTNAGNLNLTTGSAFQINSVNVLSATTLGSGVVNASLTSNTGNLTNAGNLNLTTGSAFQVNSVNVLSATTLGSGVVNASLTTNSANLNIITQSNADFALTITGLSGNRSLYMGRTIVAGELECVIQAVDNGGTTGQVLHLNNLDSAGVIIGTGIDAVVSGKRLYVDGNTAISGTLQTDTITNNTVSDILISNTNASKKVYVQSDNGFTVSQYSASTNKSINLQYDTTNDYGVIYGVQTGVAFKDIQIGVAGGTGNLRVYDGNVNLIQTTNQYQISSTNVLSATTLGTGVINSSLQNTNSGSFSILNASNNNYQFVQNVATTYANMYPFQVGIGYLPLYLYNQNDVGSTVDVLMNGNIYIKSVYITAPNASNYNVVLPASAGQLAIQGAQTYGQLYASGFGTDPTTNVPANSATNLLLGTTATSLLSNFSVVTETGQNIGFSYTGSATSVFKVNFGVSISSNTSQDFKFGIRVLDGSNSVVGTIGGLQFFNFASTNTKYLVNIEYIGTLPVSGNTRISVGISNNTGSTPVVTVYSYSFNIVRLPYDPY